MLLLRHETPLRPVHPDAARLGRDRRRRAGALRPHEAPREARARYRWQSSRTCFPYLARLLSVRLDPETTSVSTTLPEELAAEIRRAYKHWLVSIARERPVVVAIEDLHWADPPTCELAEQLLDLVDLTPILVVATSRVDPTSDGWRLRVRALSHHVHRASSFRWDRCRTRRASSSWRAAAEPGRPASSSTRSWRAQRAIRSTSRSSALRSSRRQPARGSPGPRR